MFPSRENKPEPVPVQKMPGYVPDLHVRKPGEFECDLCGIAWPCLGAGRQLIDARRFTNNFWTDEQRFAAAAGLRRK